MVRSLSSRFPRKSHLTIGEVIMRRAKLVSMAAAAAAGMALLSSRAYAVYSVQNTLSGTDWSMGASWSTTAVPDATNLVVIPSTYSNTLTIPAGTWPAYAITSNAANVV